MELNDLLTSLFVARIKSEINPMTIEQVPVPYQDAVRAQIESGGSQ